MDTYKDPAGTAGDADVMDTVSALIGMPETEDDNSDLEDISSQIRENDSDNKKENDDASKSADADRASVKQFRKGRKKWVKWLIILIILLGIIGLIVYNVIFAKNKIMDAAAGSSQEAEVKRMDITKAISATGTIQSKDIRTLTSPLSGVKIEEVNCKVGDMVEQGTVVVAFSREDINKKIGQLEEDITEANKTKALDSGDRTNTYVNNHDLETYNVATAYEALNRADKDLQTAKDDLQKACDDKAEFKRLHDEAKENIDDVEEELLKKQDELSKLKGTTPQQGEEEQTDELDESDPNYKKIAELTNEISSLSAKISKYRDALDNYDKNIKSYESAEEKAQSAVDTAQRTYDDAFVKFNKMGYDASFSNAKSDYNLNKGNLTADDNVKSLQRQMEERVDSLDNYIVTAPITGLVTEVNAQEGNGYQATTGALMTIQAVDIFEVTTQIDEYDINNVSVGQQVKIMTDATGEDELEGKVTFIAPIGTAATGNSTSNTFQVKIDILNKDERLRLGMSAKLNLVVDSHNGVLAVPYDAIEEEEGGAHFVYVADKKDNAPADKKTVLGIEVIGMDGEKKETKDLNPTSTDAGGGFPARGKGKKIPVQIGLEGDYYTEIISTDIKEGMTVYVNSQAGEVKDGGPGPMMGL